MPQLMQISRVHLFAEGFFVGFDQAPDIFEEENDLRRQRERRGLFVGELRPDKQPSVSGSMPSRRCAAFGQRSKVTGNASTRSRSGPGSAASVAFTSSSANAWSFCQLDRMTKSAAIEQSSRLANPPPIRTESKFLSGATSTEKLSGKAADRS